MDRKILFCGRICSWLGHSTSCETALDVHHGPVALGEMCIAKPTAVFMSNHGANSKPIGISRTYNGPLYVVSLTG